MNGNTPVELCQTCGSAVRVVGHTTLSYQPIERMTEEELQKIEASLFPDSYDPREIFGEGWGGPLSFKRVDPRKPLLTALRNAYAEIDVLRSDRNNLLAVIEGEIALPENKL